MPAAITGKVFNDLNRNGLLDSGEPGIPDVFITLFSSSAATCTQVFTDANGEYRFTVTAAGNYRIYENVDMSSACPPETFTQPGGFLNSNGPRVITVTVTSAQINNNSVISGQNFSHDDFDGPLTCSKTMVQFVNTPTEWYDIDILTGTPTFRGLLNPVHNVNAIGYNILDNYIYGYDQSSNRIVRADANQTLTQLAPLPNGLPANGYNVGTFDLAGHLFIMVNAASRFYTVDLAPNSPTYMKLVDPANGFAEQIGNFGTALSTALEVSDWAFSPIDGFLYGVRSVGNTAQVMRVNPATGAVTGLTTSMPALNPTGRSWGAVAMDVTGALFAIYNGDGGVFRFAITGNNALGIRLSTTFTTSFNDAAMCPEALVIPLADLSVTKSAAPNPVRPGNMLDYFITVENLGPDSAENTILTDTVPSGILSPLYSIDGGTTFFPWTGSLNLGGLAAGQSVNVIIRGVIAEDAAEVLFNTAEVTSETDDPNPANNTSTVTVEVITPRGQAITDIIESVALEQAALAHILNAEGEKLQRIIGEEEISPLLLLEANRSVRSTTGAVALLESILAGKLNLFSDCICINNLI